MSQPASSLLVGRAIRVRRENLGLTPARVARGSGISVEELDAIESGRTQASIRVLGRVAHALNTVLIDVVRGAGTISGPARARQALPMGLPEIARAIADLPHEGGSKVDAVILATVRHAMAECGDNQSAAARVLGMERKAFGRRLHRARRGR
jgi:transcriptional regulator with XRE-family HTH domain